MRQSWTDDRLDDFRSEVNRRFDEVDRKFDKVDERFDKIDRKIDKGFDKVDARLHNLEVRFDSLQKMLIYAVIAFASATMAGWASVIALVLTQT